MTPNYFDWRKASMPETRKADIHLSCHDYSVFIDLNLNHSNLIYLNAISFDGYGYCGVESDNIYLNEDDTQSLLYELSGNNLNNELVTKLIKKLILMNKDKVWNDALQKYHLI